MAVWTFLGTQSMSHVPSSNPFTVATIVKTDGKQNQGFHDLTERQMPKFQTWMLVEWLQKKQKKTYTSSIASWWRFEFTKGRQFCERVDHTSSQFQSYFQGPCNIQSRNGFFRPRNAGAWRAAKLERDTEKLEKAGRQGLIFLNSIT